MRIAVITTAVFPEQVAIWRACQKRGVSIRLIGTGDDVYKGAWPWKPRPPEDLECVLLPLLTLSRHRERQTRWLYRGLGDALRQHQPDLIHVLTEPWGLLLMQSMAV